ncbi:methionyl-tRNA formyltransferase [Eubacteriales bacterium OttesenSCG-928-G02]|nr:methionyl-tRNA formyltransferase [Eubacteriales bacterium OttesenSCG-928-G02]
MKIIFFGTPEFAYDLLKALIDNGYDISLVVTRADKPKGRGYKTVFSPVKALALENNIKIYQPESLRTEEAYEILKAEQADIFITAAYGRIFPKNILDLPPLGCINIHASLLPKLRGSSPINRAIINGDTKGGITIMKMDEGVDTGDILLQEAIDIPAEMYFDEYYNAMGALGGKLILQYLKALQSNTNIINIKQDEALATFAPKVEKHETELDFNKPCKEVYNKIRGLSPTPCAFTYLNQKRVKIFKCRLGTSSAVPGEVVKADKNGIEIACADGSIIITELQPDGKKRMDAAAFISGNRIF